MTRGRHTQSGFSLLEAIVAMVVMSTAMLALYGWLSGSILGLSRAHDSARLLEDKRAAVALIETVNPMLEPRGQMEISGLQVRWSTTDVASRRSGRSRAGMPTLFDLGLYDMNVEVLRDGKPAGTFTLRRAGWEAVRALGEEEL